MRPCYSRLLYKDARCLLPRNGDDCEFCGCQIGNEVTHIFRPKPAVADAAPNNTSSSAGNSNAHQRGWEGWLQWTLDDGTSVCSMYGGEEVIDDTFVLLDPFNRSCLTVSLITDDIECYSLSFQEHVAPIPNPAVEQCGRLSNPLLTECKKPDSCITPHRKKLIFINYREMVHLPTDWSK